ncbi:SpoIIE family protein phosphatase [Streptomyces sp. NPDC048603]|uniref:SpoIIE family protein phosphatase n=1 Tax=Streptomyces sp. NPDC048603 TaxID=3365577 RepID=UPI0037216AEB
MGFDRLPTRWLFSGAEEALLSAVAGASSADVLEQAREYGILRDILDGTSAAVAVLDERLRYLYVNAAMGRMGGVPAEAFLGRTMTEVLPDLHRSDEILRMVLTDGQPRALAVTGSTRAFSPFRRRQWSAVYHRLEDKGRVLGLCGIGVEVSGLRQYMDDLEKAHQRLALLDTATTRVGTTLGVDKTCAELAEFVTPSLADAAAVDVIEDESPGTPLPEPGMLRIRIAAVAGDPDMLRRLEQIGRIGEDVDVPRGSPLRHCLQTGRPWLGNLATDEVLRKMTTRREDIAILRAAGIHSALVIPLPTREHPVGALFLARSGKSEPFTHDDVVVAQDLAARAAVAIDNARQYTLEHTMALELQRALLSEPEGPHPDIEVASRYLPAGRSALVGGDWFDSIALPEGRTLQAMGDVMGHGFTAAVAMSQYRSLLRSLSVSGTSVEGLLNEADHRVASVGLDRFATCLLALVDPRRGTCTMSSAGHLPPALLRSGARTELLAVPTGPPLGTELGGYEALTFPIPPGAVLLLYTDGLIEQRNADIDASLRRLTELRLDVDGPLDDILDTLLRHLVPGVAEDDVALLATRVHTPG